MESGKRWYAARATYKAEHPESPRRRHLWERTTFVFRAADDDEAATVAERLAYDKENEYIGGRGDLVRWVLYEVEEVKELFDKDFENGTEVWWEFFERVDKTEEALIGRDMEPRPIRVLPKR